MTVTDSVSFEEIKNVGPIYLHPASLRLRWNLITR